MREPIRMRLHVNVLGALLQAVLLLSIFGAKYAYAVESSMNDMFKGRVVLPYVSGYYAPGNSYGFRVKTGKVTNIKVSNKKVLSARFEDYIDSKYFYLTIKRTGTSKLRYTYKGKRHTVTIVAKKYVNPVKKVMLGKKNITKAFNADPYHDCPGTYRKTITVKPKAGWKLKSIVCSNYQRNTRIRNGGRMPLITCGVDIILVQKKTGLRETLELATE